MILKHLEIKLEDIQVTPASYGQEGLIFGRINNYNGDLIFVQIELELDGTTYQTITDSTGNFQFIITNDLPAGTYSAIISILEDDYILYFEYGFNLIRSKGYATISIINSEKVFNDGNDIVGTLTFQSSPLSSITLVIYINNNEIGRSFIWKEGLNQGRSFPFPL